MRTGSKDLIQACRTCVEVFAGGEDDKTLVAATDLLRHPVSETVRWLGGAVVLLAEGLSPPQLEQLTSRRLPDRGAVQETILALRDHPGTLDDAARRDPVELVLRLAATAAVLLEQG